MFLILGSSEDTLNTLRYSDRVKELKKQGSSKTTNGLQIDNNYNMDVENESEDYFDDNFEELEEID